MFKRIVTSCVLKEKSTLSMITRNAGFFGNYFEPHGPPIPPYHHVCQIGDPTLRAKAEVVEPGVIPTPEFKQFIDHLIKTMRRYGAYGLSAPQLGLASQVFAIEMTENNVEECVKTKSAGQPVEVVPLTVFINPKMKILDYNTVAYPEACASVYGYVADVPRAKSIQIEALDVTGKKFIWKAEGWPAKMAQHEMDHLQGVLFTDKMDSKTLHCALWSIVNQRRGNVGFKFCPESGIFSSLKNLFI